ncbi:MAG TPA: hypothetical protein PK677_11190 [Acidiphilium sp.]|nr:hypothetical protein [Acidiphilium sp.]
MTELSDADLEMAAEIQAAFSGISKERALAVLRTEFNPSAMLTAARTLVTAEILAAARVNERETRIVFDGPPGPKSGRFVEVEDANGTSFNAGEWHERSDGLWELRLHPSATLARLAAENQRMRDALGYFLTDDRFQAAVGGNPIVVEAMLRTARAALGDKP